MLAEFSVQFLTLRANKRFLPPLRRAEPRRIPDATAPRPGFPKAAGPCAPFVLERDADAFISSPHVRRKARKPRRPRESREKRRRRPSRHTRGSSDGRPNRTRPALIA